MEIFQMSISASVLIILMIAVRPAVKNKVSGNVLMLVWGIICCKLMMPDGLLRPIEKMGRMAVTSLQMQTEVEDIAQTLNMPKIPLGFDVIQDRVAQSNTVIWKIIWLIGIFCLGLYFLYTYLHCICIFRQSLPMGKENFGSRESEDRINSAHSLRRHVKVRISDRICSPLTYGIVHPVILLPKKMDLENSERLDYILLHELAHIKRLDALGKICLAAVLTCHWFNPFVWIMYYLANRDIELACDEEVIRMIGNGKRSAYAGVLLEWEAQKTEVNLLASCFMQHFMKERILHIMKKKKVTIMGIVLSLILIAGSVVIYVVTPAEKRSEEDKEPVPIDSEAVVVGEEETKETDRGETLVVTANSDGTEIRISTGQTEEEAVDAAAAYLDDPTLGGIFELYTPEEYETVIDQVKKYADGEGGDKNEVVKRMEDALEKLKADNGKGEFVIYKPAFEERYEENGIVYGGGLDPLSIMAPEQEWRPESSPLTAEVYEQETERMMSVFDTAVKNGTLTEGQRQRILDKIEDNLEKLRAKE